MATIVFIGFRGSGKTTLGRWLAGELGVDFIDTDVLVLERLRFKSVALAWEAVGEGGWRETEAAVIPPLLQKEAVIAFGGGAPMIPQVKKALSGVPIVIHLIADAQETARRVGGDDDRPALAKGDQEIRLERLPLYAMLATCEIDTSGPIADAQAQILNFLNN